MDLVNAELSRTPTVVKPGGGDRDRNAGPVRQRRADPGSDRTVLDHGRRDDDPPRRRLSGAAVVHPVEEQAARRPSQLLELGDAMESER
jgi:hypothetical protein